ncbi:MAG TPA: adenylate/guanylate cyclase domain-containing protein, partial [Longimicrobiales bacterium]|nr:adenylate/guanylate cyclase domain-containing protein [Longimicrobiales bacterium]
MTLKRRLAAVMFTDMAGYTGLMHRDEAAALRSRARHRKALEESLEDRGGKVLQYFGDGSLSIFDSSVEAVEAAIAIQRALDGDPLLRIGLHSGDIAFDVQGAYGDAVNIAARLEARCTPGGVTISQVIYEDIRRHPELKVVSCGTVPLKHIPEPVLIYALAVEGLRTPEEAGPAPGTAPRSADDLPASLLERLDELSRQPWGPRGGVGALMGRVPLVGRETELDAMRAALDRAEAGQSSSLFVRGARGVGKTRLSWEMAEEARARGWTVLQGRAHPSERRVPYAPFSDAFMPLLRGLDPATLVSLTPGQDAALCELFPALGPAPEVPDLGPSAPGEPRTRLYWQFAALLARLAAHRPLLLILEDLDFADRASLELLGFVARQCAPEAIVFVGEYAGTDPDSRRV